MLGLNEMKTGCSKNTQNVVVNVHNDVNPSHKGIRKAVIDGEEASDVVIVEQTPTPSLPSDVNVDYENPYTQTREISTEEDIKNDYEQLLKVVKTKDAITQALSIILNLVEHNPLIINKYIVSPKDILTNLILLLTEADKVDILLSYDDIGCSCTPNTNYAIIDKIYVTKNGETTILKYKYADVIQILESHKISSKLVLTDDGIKYN
jgi:hypothetical protein